MFAIIKLKNVNVEPHLPKIGSLVSWGNNGELFLVIGGCE